MQNAPRRFDQESPNFIQTSIPNHSTTILEMTSLTTSGGKLSWKNCQKCCNRWLRVEFFQNGFSEDHQILHLSLTISPTNPAGYDVTNCCRSTDCNRQLNTAQKYVKRVWSKSRIIWPLFNVKPPNFTGLSMPIKSTATPDMTSPALLPVGFYPSLKKRTKTPPLMTLGCIFVAWRFACPNQLVGFLSDV